MNPNCEQKKITIRTWSGTRLVSAHCYQDFAVHRWDDDDESDRWRLTHLPTGLLVATGSWGLDNAIEAMIKVARLRNDWAVISDSDLTLDLANKVSEIVAEHDGRRTGGDRDFKGGFNGYEDGPHA